MKSKRFRKAECLILQILTPLIAKVDKAVETAWLTFLKYESSAARKIRAESTTRDQGTEGTGAYMRFSLGLLVGYCMRAKNQLLIIILAFTIFVVFLVLPAIALTGLAISVQHRSHSRPAQTRVPSIEGLKYEIADATLRASNLKIQVLATRSDLRLAPGVIVNQVPQPGQQVDLGYIVSVTVSATDLQGPSR
jgi:hypothetical protein